MFSRISRDEEEASISNSHISSRISSCVASGVILCFVGYIITLRATLARTEKFPRARKGEGRARMGWMLRKFGDDFPESVIRRSAGTRASFVSIKRLRGKPIQGNVCALCENGTRRGGLQTRSNNTTATIGRILMTLPALAWDNRNGFIRFTYTPRDLSAFRLSRRCISHCIEVIKNIYYHSLLLSLSLVHTLNMNYFLTVKGNRLVDCLCVLGLSQFNFIKSNVIQKLRQRASKGHFF